MTISTILAPGLAAAASADVVVLAGETVTVGIFSAVAGALRPGDEFSVTQITPGAENYLGSLGNQPRSTQLVGPGTFRVNRPLLAGLAFGVFKEV